MFINSEPALAELTRLHQTYEKALMDNDVETLDSLFWDSEHAIRYGVTENLYGTSEIRAFRQARTMFNLAREIERLEITTFGDSAGVINLQFSRAVNDVVRRGRQTQFWMKLPEGWRIVSAHVSFLFSPGAAYVDDASLLLTLPIKAEDHAAVVAEFQRLSAVANGLLSFPVDQSIEAAPVFQP